MLPFDAAVLVLSARRRGGLSQRAMAERAGTSQSVVARIETGVTDPSGETLRRLLAAAGLEVRCELALAPVLDTHMLEDVRRILSLTPEQRLMEVKNLSRFMAAARGSQGDPGYRGTPNV
jgi:transcriptional regulator with XRE-family HTH domain